MRAEIQPAGVGDPDVSAASAGSLRILVVENHSDTRQGVRTFLRLLGHEVSCAESVDAALALAARERFDVLLSDISLPDGNGWALLAQLETRGNRPAHAIAMSGLGSPADCSRSREAGFELHLIKPFAPEALEEALGRLAGRIMGVETRTAPPGKGPVADWRQKMHDGLCQYLVAAALMQEALIRRLEKLSPAGEGGGERADYPPEEIVANARQIGALLDDALTESRALMRGE